MRRRWRRCAPWPALHRSGYSCARVETSGERHGEQQRTGGPDRQHAAGSPASGVGTDGVRDPRQGRIHEPGRLGQGPHRARHHPRRRAPWRAAPGRAHRRGHGGQHRHRAEPAGQCARLSHHDRDTRDPEPREDRDADALRRRAAAGAGRARQRSQPLREDLRAAGAGIRGARNAGCGLGQPVRQHRQPRDPPRHHRARDLGADARGGVDGFICSVGTGGTLAGVAEYLRARRIRVCASVSRIPAARRCTTIT
jgi:hypothetical protein